MPIPQLADRQDIINWSNRAEAGFWFPELIRQLVSATSKPTRIEFRTQEGAGLPGFDGYTEITTGNAFIPDGVVAWELGTDEVPTTKANKDYKKRTDNPPENIDPSQTVYISFSSRSWPRKSNWAAKKRLEGKWRDIKAFDVDDIMTWLVDAPAVHIWLSWRLGKPLTGVRDLQSWWEGWSQETNPTITPELILSGRKKECEQFEKSLTGTPQIIPIESETKDEAEAFVSAVIAQQPPNLRDTYFSKAILIDSPDAWIYYANSRSPLILIRRFNDSTYDRLALSNGNHVIVVQSQQTIDEKLYRRTSLKTIIDSGSAEHEFSTNIREILNEPSDILELTFDQPILLYGPPNIGKTTLAVRQGWKSLQHPKAYDHVFYLNARVNYPFDIRSAHPFVRRSESMLVIVDDIHFATPNLQDWVMELEKTMELFQRVTILWIARDNVISAKLTGMKMKEPVQIEFPLERVVSLFLTNLDQYPEWQRVIAAFECQLDPRLAIELRAKTSKVSTISDFIDSITEMVDDLIHSSLRMVSLGTAKETYQSLLPFGSLGSLIELDFLNLISSDPLNDIECLRELGLASLTRDRHIALTEHPFQIRRKLNLLSRLHVPTKAHRILQDWLYEKTQVKSNISARSTSDVIFALYYLTFVPYNQRKARLNELVLLAEWSGVREPLASALEFLLEIAESDSAISDMLDLGDDLVLWWLKLTRSCYPENEKLFTDMLSRARTFWNGKREAAEASALRKVGSIRLDTILYEIGYIEYLSEQYESAAETFALSVEVALDLIKRGMIESDQALRNDACYALSNIWIAASLERSATLRKMIFKALLDKRSFDESEITKAGELVTGIADIWRTLYNANASPKEQSGEMYLRALSVVSSTWQPPSDGVLILRDELKEEQLGRHEMNAWAHSLETSCWPALYGVMSQRINIDTPTCEYKAPLSTPAPAVGIPLYRINQIKLLVKWAEDRQCERIKQQSVAIACMMRAGGGFEYLGDLLYLAMRVASNDETKGALKYLISHRIPTVGFNGLAKLAVRNF